MKTALITGGAGLIGQEFVKAVTEQSAVAVIADIDDTLGKKTQEKLIKELNTDKVDFVKLDITSQQSLDDCINILNSKYKRIDALVNNAYPRNENYGRHFFDVEYDDFVENVGLNLGGYFIASQCFA